jgi:plasmid stabilization system protein ParE
VSLAVSFTPDAEREVIEAYDWYQGRAEGLGARFRSELDRQIIRIVERPLQFPNVLRDIRQARLRRFPYSLFFRHMNEGNFIIASFHASRDPQTWQRRVAPPEKPG